MSGPKISNYNLSPEARKNMQEQILCECRSILCAKEIRRLLIQMTELREAAQTELSHIRLSEQYDTSGVQSDVLSDMLTSFSSDTARFLLQLQEETPAVTSRYVLTDAELQKRKSQLKRLRDLKQAVLTSAKPLQHTLEECRGKQQTRSEELKSAIAARLNAEASFERSVKTADEILAQKKREVSKHLEELLTDDDCPVSLKKPLQNAILALERIDSAEHFTSFCSITADTLKKRFCEEKADAAAKKAKLKELTDRYITLGEMIGAAEQDIPADIDFLEKRIAEMEQQLIREREQEYISASIDEVMVEMGYDLIGYRDVTKKSGKHFHNELYSFGDGIAVNVTYSSDGQIAMELGGLAHEDRIPTEEECDILVDGMEEFCSDFEEIERRLSEKGVVLKSRIMLSPPTVEHAAIINAGDYEIADDKTASDLHIAAIRKKTVTAKVLHRRDD